MSQRLKIIVAYDGNSFSGWQSQAHRNGVQDHLEKAFQAIAGKPVRVHGAGRTDAGVHALAQCAHVDVQKQGLTPAQWLRALNGHLPPQLRVLRCQKVSAEFHARYSARGKLYRYRIWTGAILPPLEYGRTWHVFPAPDYNLLKLATSKFVGRHDFAAFAANRGKPEIDTIRTIEAISVRGRGAVWTIDVEGSGFLYKMVRLLVGTSMECARGTISAGEIVRRLEVKDRSKSRLVAPAAGLYLVQVRY